MRIREEVQKVPREGLGHNKGRTQEPLGKRERVLRSFAGKEVDRRPFTFWHPFGLAHMKSDSLTAAALTFAATYGVDLLRMPLLRDLPLPAQSSLDRAHDLAAIEPISAKAGFWGERLEALKATVKLAEKKIAVFETIADPLTALGWLCPPDTLAGAERNHRSFLEKGLAVITESYKGYLKALFEEAKIDGLVLEVGAASFEARPPEDFESLLKPFLGELVEFMRSLGASPLWIQVTGKRVYLEPILSLSPDMLSWSHLAHGPSLEKLPKSYRRGVAGGLNELSIPHSSYQDLRRQIDEARNFPVRLLCPGDALPADTTPSKLLGLANFLQKRDRLPEVAPTGERPARVIDEP